MGTHINMSRNNIKRKYLPEAQNNRLDGKKTEENETMSIEENDSKETGSNFEQVKKKMKTQSLRLKEHHFKTYISRLNKVLKTELQIGRQALQDMDEYIAHIIKILDEELQRLSDKRRIVTLSERDLATVLKLCIPKHLADKASEYGTEAVRIYFENLKKTALSAENSRLNVRETEENDAMSIEENNPKENGSNFERVKKKMKTRSLRLEKHHFKRYISILHKVLKTELQIGSQALQDMDEYIAHIIKILDEELQRLSDKRRIVTLTERDVATVLKLCVPKNLADKASEYGTEAVRIYFENLKKTASLKTSRMH